MTCFPVFVAQTSGTAKLSNIVRNRRQVVGRRNRSNQNVVGANRLANTRKRSPNLSAMALPCAPGTKKASIRSCSDAVGGTHPPALKTTLRERTDLLHQ